MKQLIWIVPFLALSLRVFSIAPEVYFSPSSDCENRLTKAIQESQKEVQAAVYSINNRKIVEALKDAKKRGVKVRVLTDHIQATQRSSRVFDLLENGIDLRVHSKFKIEHNKFGVFDGKLVSTGSFNWTGPAARSNSENCIFLADPQVIKKYEERFEFLWEKNTADGSKARLTKIKAKGRHLSGQRNKRPNPAHGVTGP
jgi:phosphatidylserine/phosphatidylglycerophosphate/cardiolipin synthase-like enzyme